MTNDSFYLSDEEQQHALDDSEQELNDEFLFNDKNFNTIIIEKKSNDNSDKQQILDVERFLEQYQKPSEKNDLLLWLKLNNYKHLLIQEIQNTKEDTILSKLLCAYWEAGFNDPNDLLVFIPHLLSKNFSVALEANSAIIALNKPFVAHDVHHALQMIQDAYNDLPSDNITLVDQIIELLNSELSDQE